MADVIKLEGLLQVYGVLSTLEPVLSPSEYTCGVPTVTRTTTAGLRSPTQAAL